jgi:hypothetical protein
VLKEKITKYMKNNKHGIEPFSPEEVERLSGGFIVSN